MAAFATFVGMKLTISTIQQYPPQHPVIRWTADNWIVICLVGIIFTSAICIVDYFFSAKTFDKLRPVYAKKAVSASEEVRNSILALPKSDREESRQEMLRNWRTQKKKIISELHVSTNIYEDILALPNGVYLQIVQDPTLQRNLHLMNPTVHSLNVIQLFISIFTASCALFVTVLCVYSFKTSPDLSKLPIMRNALSAVFFSVTFFSFFPILYAQQRSEIEYLVGTGYTIMPQVFSGIFIVGLLMALASLEPIKENIPDLVMARIIPILCVVVGLSINFLPSQPLRQIVGVEANWGTRILLIIFFLIAWILVGLHLWPWKLYKS